MTFEWVSPVAVIAGLASLKQITTNLKESLQRQDELNLKAHELLFDLARKESDERSKSDAEIRKEFVTLREFDKAMDGYTRKDDCVRLMNNRRSDDPQ